MGALGPPSGGAAETMFSAFFFVFLWMGWGGGWLDAVGNYIEKDTRVRKGCFLFTLIHRLTARLLTLMRTHLVSHTYTRAID